MVPRSETTGAPVNRSHCKLQPVPFGRVRVSGGFWATRSNLGPRSHLRIERN